MKILSDADLSQNKVKNLPAPTANGDAANKGYVDAFVLNTYSELNGKLGIIGVAAGTGWIAIPENTYYMSATTFSIQEEDYTDVFAPHDKIRLDNNGIKYFYVKSLDLSGSSTVVTVQGDGVYALEEDSVIDVCFSRVPSPLGWPLSMTGFKTRSLYVGDDSGVPDLGEVRAEADIYALGDKKVWHEGNDGKLIVNKYSRVHADDGTSLNQTAIAKNTFGFNYDTGGAGVYGSYISFGNSPYFMQLTASYSGGATFKFRTYDGDTSTWNSWHSVRHTGNTRIQLWSGSWSSGDITVTGLANYRVFEVWLADTDIRVLAFRGNGWLGGVGGIRTSTGHDTLHFGSTYSGNTVTFVGCNRLAHVPSGSHGSSTAYAVAEIYGLL